MPPGQDLFDTILCMGVLYHSRMPVEQISMLRRLLRPGGQLVLETLVVDGDAERVMVPPGRYARMRNVWFLPSSTALKRWMERCDLMDVSVVDETATTIEEQRATEWMTFHSLQNYLDPEDSNKTLEGYPAPVRATLIARVRGQ